MNKEFNPGDSVIICVNHSVHKIRGAFYGIVSTKQLYNNDNDTIIIDVETGETESETCRVHRQYVHHACQKCYGKGVIDLGGLEIECDKCNGKGYDE
jgi:ribosomal protein L21E